jgi:hypothetical protein
MSQSFFFCLLGLGMFGFAITHWPWTSKLGLYIVMAGYAVWCFWRFCVIPFKEGLKNKASSHIDP